jgi:hypothetical protein
VIPKSAPSPFKPATSGAQTPRKARAPAPATATPATSDAVVSDAAKEVMQSLLRPNAAERMTAMDLLWSAWLNTDYVPEN